MKTVGLIHKCIGVSGLNGLDQLLGFSIVHEMRGIKNFITREILSQQDNKRMLYEIFN